ncbi:FAD binding domain-containing protein [Plectosphaerella plurivora]|uniref:FAD binding domain-containing protein n=1 Tax=Plectosphaerella plurivora TaxID=936078 RepID=A0A9P8VBL2_9PEZI|nr:FAD binding domain-containing protein [Plectosphaerella plurivora]
MPREPYQRCSQAIFEAWLKPRIQAEDLIDSHFGLKFESLVESEDGVESTLVDVQTCERHIVKSQYVVGCDGAGSRIRTHIGSELIGGPVPMAMYLVHFKSKDLTTLQKQGQFWHIFFTSSAVLIAQDEIETWTAHLPITLDTNWEKMDPLQAIYDVLGGSIGPCPVKVDEIMVKSAWRPKICFADRYMSSIGRVFISGDAAHQNIPTGGYGMNTAVGDSFDLGWKLAAVLHGYGGKTLLDSYEIERKPVAVRNIERSGVHHQVHFDYGGWFRELGRGAVVGDSPELRAVLDKTVKHVAAHDGENQDHGIEMDYRFPDSPVVFGRDGVNQAEWNPRTYVPSTFPGSRAPHVFLQNGKTSIMDLYGRAFTVVDFTEYGQLSNEFAAKAQELRIPLTRLHLPAETHAAKVWGHQVVLIRPDDHVAWRLPAGDAGAVDAESILKTVTGHGPRVEANEDSGSAFVAEGKTFTSTTGNVDVSEIKLQAEFQK